MPDVRSPLACSVDYARLCDLTIVPVPERDHVSSWYAEVIIFGSGVPTMILPEARKRPNFALNTVIVAWDFGRPAARAVAHALPLLEKAKRVFVLTVANEKVIDTKRSGAELAKHLARHGVNVTLDVVDAAGRSIGEVIESDVANLQRRSCSDGGLRPLSLQRVHSGRSNKKHARAASCLRCSSFDPLRAGPAIEAFTVGTGTAYECRFLPLAP